MMGSYLSIQLIKYLIQMLSFKYGRLISVLNITRILFHDAEKIPSGVFLDYCLRSKTFYCKGTAIIIS